MAAIGAPRPWRRFWAATLFLRVPRQDWTALKVGAKTEIRQLEPDAPDWADSLSGSTPLVIYSKDSLDRNESQLMLLERAWVEPVGAIDPESIQREAFPDLAHFRRYWMGRTGERFRPLDNVWVFRMRPWREEDQTEQAVVMLQRLYREHIPGLEFEDELW